MNIVCDIDGVIADSMASAEKYLNYSKPDWNAWNKQTDKIPPIGFMVDIVRYLCNEHEVTFVTGRMKKNHFKTVKWLTNHIGARSYKLVMREDDDFSESSIFKSEVCKRLHPDLIIEDDPGTVKKLDEEGYKVLQIYGFRLPSAHDGIESKDIVPRGVTCHYERMTDGWFVVWDGDFHAKDSGRLKCNDHDSMMLEMGWQVGRSNES
jgi:hypothetical protein